MIDEIKYTSIRRVLDNLKDDSLMTGLTLEQVVRHTIRFIGLNGQPNLYQDRQATVEIHEYRGLLPCDCIRVNQVKDSRSGICLTAMTDSFRNQDSLRESVALQSGFKSCYDPMNNVRLQASPLIPHPSTLTFKTQSRVIFTSFQEGAVEVAYKAIPVDDDGFPLLIDNEKYLDALEKYITMQVIKNKFRAGKLSAQVYQDAKTDYYAAARLLDKAFTMPSVSEMEDIARIWNTMIPKMREFDNGFKDLGNREYLRKH